jgi:hypothetical protein
MVKCIVINPADNIRAETADAIRCAARVARQAGCSPESPPSSRQNVPPAENAAAVPAEKPMRTHRATGNRTVGGFTRWEQRSPKTNMFMEETAGAPSSFAV